MEERRRYEVWLAALDARRAETPKHLFTRVHADYTARLQAVVAQLTGQVEGLRAELTSLATRIATLHEQQHRARDERAEAELRAHVGEISDQEWKAAAAKSDALMASLASEHAEAQDALVRTREFLADAERPATPTEAAPALSVPREIAPVPAFKLPAATGASTGTTNVPVQGALPSQGSAPARLRPLPGREESAVPATSPPDPQAGTFDELAFLSSVVDESAAPTARMPAPPSPRPQPAAPAPPPPVARVEPVARPAPPPARNPFASRAQDKIINNDGAAGPKIESKKVGVRPLAVNITGNNPIVLRDKSNEAAKTLKCGECGAANYPTEWYCERCGAELASL
jgi:hypothetical protein